MTTPFARRCAAALALTVLAAGIAGCGGAEDEPDDGSTSAESGATEGSSDPSGASDDATTPTPSAYLTVGGVELTEPGTELRFGDPGVIAWQPGRGDAAALEVTVERVDKTSFEESFKGWVITKEMRRQTPLFVRIGVSNPGRANLGGEHVPVAVIDDSGIRVQPTTAAEKEFKPCPGGPLPARFKAGATTEMCLLYLLAPDAKFEAVGFLPIDAEGEPVGEAISWTGDLTAVGEKAEGDKGKKGKKGDKRRDRRGKRRE